MDLITKAVIMAGGEGTRLRPLTEMVPKPMLKINGIPLLHIMMEKLHSFGINHFYLSVNYLSKNICDYFKDGSGFGVKIFYIREPYSMGTAGSIGLVDIQEPFLVLNGDLYTDLDFRDFFVAYRKSGCDLFICGREETLKTEYGVIEVNENKVMSWVEKPGYTHLISCGIYMFASNIIKIIPKEHFFGMNHLAEEAIRKRKVGYYLMSQKYTWVDIGTIEDLNKCSELINR